jgi:hypothetical protein
VDEPLLDEKLSQRTPRKVRRNGHDPFSIDNPPAALKYEGVDFLAERVSREL